MARLEHVNFTVKDPQKTAAMLIDLFGWHIRWEGASMEAGYSMHVGSDDDYIALFSNGPEMGHVEQGVSYHRVGGLNHIGVVVEDIGAVEAKVKAYGLEPHKHGDYEPGLRFYFQDIDDIEWEVICYA